MGALIWLISLTIGNMIFTDYMAIDYATTNNKDIEVVEAQVLLVYGSRASGAISLQLPISILTASVFAQLVLLISIRRKRSNLH